MIVKIMSILLCTCVVLAGCGHSELSKTETKEPQVSQEARHIEAIATAQQAMGDGDYGKAITLAQAVIEKDSHNEEAYALQGLALALSGRTEDGLAKVKEAYTMNAHNPRVAYDMAMVYKLQGRLNESKYWFEQVLAQDPYNTWSLYGIATIYADQHQDEQALTWLQKAIQVDPSVKGVARKQDHFERFHGNPTFEGLVKP